MIDLKQQGLRLWNVAIGGHACGCMLKMLEDIFGLPESAESKLFDVGLIPESDTPEELPLEVEEGPSSSQVSSEMGPPAMLRQDPSSNQSHQVTTLPSPQAKPPNYRIPLREKVRPGPSLWSQPPHF